MKRIILILTTILTLASCHVQREVPTRYRSLSPFYPYLYDPIYDFYPNPYLYRRTPQVIVIPVPKSNTRPIQQPRQYNIRPQQPRNNQAPIRTFPKKDDKK